MNKNNYVAIMAGGIGSRFWPMSRTDYPKQFLDILNTGRTLIQATFDRFEQFIDKENIYIVTSEQYRDICFKQLPHLNPNNILCEPSRKNTAACIAYISYKLRQLNPEANLICAPADHLILDTEKFIKVDFLWNAGIFVWQVKNIVQAFEQYLPEMHEVFDAEKAFYYTAEEQEAINRIYPQCVNISIDYGIMEKADNVYVWLSNFAWSDLGSWNSLHDNSTKDEHNNAISGDAMIYDTRNSVIKGPKDKLIVAQGLNGYLVGAFDNVVIVCEKDKEELFRRFVNDLKAKNNGNDYL